LITLLASTLHVEADRTAFLARRNELLRGLTRPVSGAPQFDTQTMPRMETQTRAGNPVAQSVAQSVALTPAGIRHAGELLARYLGPVAKILAERAAPRAASEQALYAALAEHLQNPAERSRFLHDAGFPES
jgi:serine/threonine-protein kinase